MRTHFMEKRRDGQLTSLVFIFHFSYYVRHLSSPESERPHAIFKLQSDPRGIGSALKSYRLTESHSHRSRARKVTPLSGQIEQPFDLDRRDRQVEIRG